MVEFVEYIDEKIRIMLPKQLRQKHSMLFFKGNLVRGKPETQVAVGIDLNFDTRRFESIKEEFLRPEIKNRPPNEKLERLGPCEFGEGGLELLTSVVQPHTGHTIHFWKMLYKLQGSYLMMNIMGGGSLIEFENMAKEIITSLKLISPSQSKKKSSTSTGSMVKKVKHGGLKAKDKARLASALKSLPDDLKYLRDPILDIADEDQELLGSGVVDTPLLAEAIENQANLQPNGFATHHSKKLEEWLKSNVSKDDKWAGPVWFVMAFLMGYDAYKDGDAESTVQSLTKVVNRLLDME